MPLRTRFTELVGCTHPIQSAPMGGATTPSLVLAVAAAGGHGMLTATLMPPPVVEQLCRTVGERTQSFGVNFLVPLLQGQREPVVAAASHAPLVEFFYGPPDRELVSLVHDHSALVSWQVSGLKDASAAQALGVDMIVVQGGEAGGRVYGTTGLLPLLSRVAQEVDLPIVAAGGIGSAEGVAAALMAGAHGVRMGTRFIATHESSAHPDWKASIVSATAEDTVVSEAFSILPLGLGVWPGRKTHRVLSSAVKAATALDGRPAGTGLVGGQQIELPAFCAVPPDSNAAGEIKAMALYAGQSVELVNDVRNAGDVVTDLSRGAVALLERRVAV